MNSRLVYYILGILVLIAVVVRILNPPEPLPPGPVGQTPTWKSGTALGNMDSWAVNPEGTMWAGAWNAQEKDKLRSAVWFIDFAKAQPNHIVFESPAYVHSVVWVDDNVVAVLKTDSGDPGKIDKSEIIKIDSRTGKTAQKMDADVPIAAIVAWLNESNTFMARLAGDTKTIRINTFEYGGGSVGKEIALEGNEEVSIDRLASLSLNAEYGAVCIREDRVGSEKTCYFLDFKNGASKAMFKQADLPGRLEGMWAAPAGVLLVTSERDKFKTLIWNSTDGKLSELGKSGLNISAWPSAPKSIMFVSYNAGYDYTIETGKTKELFDLSKLGKNEEMWRREVQEGRLYPRPNGDYTSVSYAAGSIDIRTITKDGLKGDRILARN